MGELADSKRTRGFARGEAKTSPCHLFLILGLNLSLVQDYTGFRVMKRLGVLREVAGKSHDRTLRPPEPSPPPQPPTIKQRARAFASPDLWDITPWKVWKVVLCDKT